MSENKDHSLRIFTIILQMEQLLESAPKPKLGGGSRRLIDVSEIFDLLGDLKVTIPEDIRRAQSVLLEADSLLEHANEEALEVMDQAQKESTALHIQAMQELEQTRQAAEEEFEARVAENNVLLEVQRRCELLQQHAEHSANAVYDGAKQYADAILQHLQNYLIENYNRIEKNRSELGIISSPPQQQVAQEAQYAASSAPSSPVPQAPAAYPESPAPVEPILPQDTMQPQAAQGTYAPAYETREREPRPKRRLFQRADNDFLDEEVFEDDEPLQDFSRQQEAPAPHKSRRRRPTRELDLDLDDN